jgi:hypothetical protein
VDNYSSGYRKSIIEAIKGAVGDANLLQPILFLRRSSLLLSSYLFGCQTDNGVIHCPNLFGNDIILGGLRKSGETAPTRLIAETARLFINGTAYFTSDKNVTFCLPLIDPGRRGFLLGDVVRPRCGNMLKELVHIALALDACPIPNDHLG